MTHINESANDDEIDVPKWDVALESLVNEECRKTARALTIDDFGRLSTQYTIRFDDIMETVFQLCIHGLWQYRDKDGRDVEITQDVVNKLYVDARLHEKDLRDFSGEWTVRT